jgi:predicted O-methyltransferase YrrM
VWITQAHRDVGLSGAHYALDPNQTKQYCNMGELLVNRCGLTEHLTVIEKTSYRALPLLLEQVLAGVIPKFHMIYIDGWHTFDYTLVDFFYADLLLEKNGVIVLDDVKHTPVKKCLDYIRLNYPHYEVVSKTPCFRPGDPSASSQATFIKHDNDERTWNHHVDF